MTRLSLPGRALRAGAALAVGALALALAPSSPSHADNQLVGLFRITAGSCGSSSITGSYFRMILANGGTNGPYLANSNSGCSDQTFTPLTPGSDGGLRTGGYQPPPSPAFTSSGDARVGTITGPVRFYGTNFATGTNATDPQTGTAVSAPRITVNGNQLGGDLRAFAVTWNKQYFNQGSPKPDGSSPGNTRAVSGTYDAASGRFTLDWTSQIVGGPFNNFTGKWHLEGVFVPAGGAAAAAPAASAAGAAPHAAASHAAASHAAATPGTHAATSAGSAAAAPSATGASGSAGSSGSAAGAAPGASTPPTASSAPSADSSAVPSTEQVAASTPTVTTHVTSKPVWSVSWPVVAVAAAIGALALLALVALARLGRKAA